MARDIQRQLRRNIQRRVLNWPGSMGRKVGLYVSRRMARNRVRGATRTGRVVQVLRGNSGQPVASTQFRGVRKQTAPRALGQRGEMIALRGRFPVPRGSFVQTFYGPLPVGARGIRGAGAQRVEGGGGGTNPSQKAYRNSARYRERHGLGAGA